MEILRKIDEESVTSGVDSRLTGTMGESLVPFFEAIRDHYKPLTQAEKAAMLSEIDLQINHFSVPHEISSDVSPFFEKIGAMLAHFVSMPALAIFVLFFLTAGSTFAAEGTLPGDFLYPVKVYVNENIRSGLTLGQEAKAEWELTLAERRLEEAETLSSEDRLDEKTELKLANRLTKHADRIDLKLRKLREKGRGDAARVLSVKFESTLAAHARVFASQKRSHPLAEKMRLLLEDKVTQDSDDDTLDPEGLKVATEATVKAAERKISEVRHFIETQSRSSDASARADASARLDMAETELAGVKAKIEAGAYRDAFGDVKQTLRSAHEAKIFLKHEREKKEIRRERKETDTEESDEDDKEDGRVNIDGDATVRVKVNVD